MNEELSVFDLPIKSQILRLITVFGVILIRLYFTNIKKQFFNC
jgi:hypothetical protein